MAVLELTRGAKTLIDDNDLPLVSGIRWFACSSRRSFYAGAKIDGKLVLMHRLLMSPPKGLCVDHANHDTLDNRRCNLRVATYGQNTANGTRKPGFCGYRGVRQERGQRRFRARLRADNEFTHLGMFDTAEEAARAYDRAASAVFGEFANLNFPDEIRS